jgi:threonine aldolase
MAGAVLAGPADVIAEARVWQHRHGGTLIHLFPYVLSAQHGLQTRLGRIDAYYQKAMAVAQALRAIPQIRIVPDPPVTNMMHLFIQADGARLHAAAAEIAQETGVLLFRRFSASEVPGYHKAEFVAGDATLDLADDEIVALFRSLLTRAGA